MWVKPSKLHELGVVGINHRNHSFIAKYNPRKLYPLVDDKLKTKKIAQNNGLSVPELYGTISYMSQVKKMVHEIIKMKKPFVIKPAQGSGGNGILVIKGIHGEDLMKADGSLISLKQVYGHIFNILSGLYSLGGKPDVAMIEYCVQFSDIFSEFSYQGVPDIRIIVFKGIPVMSMMRLATKESDGRANLHQGAVGVGLDIRTGQAVSAVHHNRRIFTHPDTDVDLLKLKIPNWDDLLSLAASCYEMTKLGYIGTDIVIDKNFGPMILELNARPGLAIQIANGCGLQHRLETVEKIAKEMTLPQRIEFAKSNFFHQF